MTERAQLFPFGTPVQGDDLVGRDAEITQILHDLRGGQHLLLPGPRRIGKSSIILECLAQLATEKRHTVYIDLMGVNSVRELANVIVAAVINSDNGRLRKLMLSATTTLTDLLAIKEFKLAYRDFETVVILRDRNTPDADAIRMALEFTGAYAAKHRQQIVCAFDEFGEVARLDAHLPRLMRTIFQQQSRCTCIFSGSQESILRHMFSHPKEPFYGFTKVVQLPATIEAIPFAHYIQKKFRSARLPISGELALQLCAATASHPFYTKVLANHVHEYVMMHHLKAIDRESILAYGYRKAFASLKSDLERQWLDLEPGITRRICAYLAATDNTAPFSKSELTQEFASVRIAQSLKTLQHKGILQKLASGRYGFVNHFFQDYVCTLHDSEYLEQRLRLT